MKDLFPGFSLIGTLAIVVLAAGCANTQHTENLLSSAGFKTVIATTAQQQQHLKTLPADRVTKAQWKGKIYYVYADPANNQIYVGSPSQYQKYQQLRLASNLAADQLETAHLNSWGWSVWGFPE